MVRLTHPRQHQPTSVEDLARSLRRFNAIYVSTIIHTYWRHSLTRARENVYVVRECIVQFWFN